MNQNLDLNFKCDPSRFCYPAMGFSFSACEVRLGACPGKGETSLSLPKNVFYRSEAGEKLKKRLIELKSDSEHLWDHSAQSLLDDGSFDSQILSSPGPATGSQCFSTVVTPPHAPACEELMWQKKRVRARHLTHIGTVSPCSNLVKWELPLPPL